VFVDGKLRGTTPLILNDVLIGERMIKISKDGYESVTKLPNVVEDQKSDIIVALQSIRNKSKVTFSCNVHIDSLMVDGLPVKLDGINYLTPGTHKISFVLDGHEITDNIIVPKVGKHFNLMISRKNYYDSSYNNGQSSSNSESLFYEKSEVEDKVFDVVEQMPTFPGGQGALMKYLADNIKYPAEAQKNGVQGRVVVSFVVERDGSLSDFQIVRSVDPSIDEEAIRVAKAMPRWIPGRQNGSTTRVKYNIPVSFRLQ
jgi:TonB family protein